MGLGLLFASKPEYTPPDTGNWTNPPVSCIILPLSRGSRYGVGETHTPERATGR